MHFRIMSFMLEVRTFAQNSPSLSSSTIFTLSLTSRGLVLPRCFRLRLLSTTPSRFAAHTFFSILTFFKACLHFNMRESTALKALQLVGKYMSLNEAARSNHMLIYLIEATLYMAAKFDESGLAVTFVDFHMGARELPSFGSLLKQAEVRLEEIRWEPGMFQMLEQSLLQTLRWQVDLVTPFDFLVLLLSVRARLQIDEVRKPKFFCSASFGSKESCGGDELADPENASGLDHITSILPLSLIMTILCLCRKYSRRLRRPPLKSDDINCRVLYVYLSHRRHRRYAASLSCRDGRLVRRD